MTEFEDKSAPATKKSRCDFAESYENSLSFESDGNETASDSEEEESSAQFDSADESSSPTQSTMNKTPENCEQPYNGVGSSRLGDCEVCARAAAKYACPECEVKTCSLHCVKIHKIELQCDGVRSRVKFRRMEKLTSLDILSDYRLLEETNRAVSTAKQSNELCLLQNRRFFGQKKGSFLIQGAQRKEIGLKLLPVSFTKRKQNSTRYLKNSNEFMWKVKWVFRQADSLEFVEHNVSDNLVIGDVVMKYFDSGKYSDPKTASRMKPYVGRGLHEVEVLLPAHGIAGTKYFIMNLKETIAENLKYKNFVEHPTFHVILDMHLGEFSFVHTVIKGKNFLEYNENDEIDQELPPE